VSHRAGQRKRERQRGAKKRGRDWGRETREDDTEEDGKMGQQEKGRGRKTEEDTERGR
jgi:hypothetical protein